MTSLCGCAGEDFSEILRALGYVMTKRTGPAITKALVPLAPMEEVSAVAQTSAEPASEAPEQTDQTPAPAAEEPEQTEQTSGEAQVVASDSLSETPAEPSADTLAPEAGAADAAVPEAVVAEEAEIEIWRQQRQHRPRHQGQDRHKGRHKGAGSTPSTDTSSPEEKKEGASPRRDRPAFKARPQGGEGGKSEAGEGRSFRPKRSDHKGHDGKPQGERGSQERGGKNQRQSGRDRPMSSWQDQPRKQSNQEPDPNSPFAKLLALKAQMQGGSDQDKS